MVWTDVEPRIVPADQRSFVAAGAEQHSHDPPYHHEEHGGRRCSGRAGIEGCDAGEADRSSEGAAVMKESSNMKTRTQSTDAGNKDCLSKKEVDHFLNSAVTVLNQEKLDMNLLRAQRALDFTNPERRMFGRIEGKVWDFFANTAPDEGYNFREGQYDMAEGVVKSIRLGEHLAVEAGVGIGKSFGYLVPLVLYHVEAHKPIVIATSTIALQEQLADDLESLLYMLDLDEPFIVAKGQNNYICKRRAMKYRDRWGDTKIALQVASGLDKHLADRKNFPPDIPDKEWNQINVRNYKKKDCGLCQHAEQCYYFQMRQDLPHAGIVICNQDLLAAHFRVAERFNTYLLNPDVSVIVIDEAHNLEGKIRFANTTSISSRGLIEMARRAEESIPKAGDGMVSAWLKMLEDAIDLLFVNVSHQAIRQSKWELIKLQEATRAAGNNYSKQELFNLLETEKFFFRNEDGAFELVTDMLDKLNGFVKYHSRRIAGKIGYPTEQVAEIADFRDKLLEMHRNMSRYVFWSERIGKSWALCYCPRDIADICNNLFFSGKHTTILTSATMTSARKGANRDLYAYWAEGIGFPKERSMPIDAGRLIPERLGTHFGSYQAPIPSPFNYDEHAMIYYTNDMPHPTKEHEEFLKAGIERLKELLDISEGRALVLFTSKTDMHRVAQELRKNEFPYNVLVQAPGSSQEDVLNAFREDEHAVLLGTGSYWEGISVEGATLSNLVIFRLPFAVPDPITAQKEEGKKDPLMEVRVPEMIIKLKQGVGRLIRNEDDKGIVSIIDSRMGDQSSVPYKGQVWDAMPMKNRTSSLDEIQRFYQEVVMGAVVTEDE